MSLIDFSFINSLVSFMTIMFLSIPDVSTATSKGNLTTKVQFTIFMITIIEQD